MTKYIAYTYMYIDILAYDVLYEGLIYVQLPMSTIVTRYVMS